MKKLSNTSKRLILWIFAVLIVYAFLATSISPLTGYSETQTNTKPIFDVNLNNFVSENNSSSIAGYVKYTLLLSNNTVISGNFIKVENGICPSAISFDSNNGYLYVTNSVSNNVSVINGSTNTIVNTISVGIDPRGISFDSNNGYLYVTNSGSNNVSVINATTNSVSSNIIVGVCPTGISLDSDNGYIYVLNFNSQTLSVISNTKNYVINTISLPGTATSISFDPKNGYIYVINS